MKTLLLTICIVFAAANANATPGASTRMAVMATRSIATQPLISPG